MSRFHDDRVLGTHRTYYSVPPGRIGTTVAVQWDGRVVRILDRHTGEFLREHRVDSAGRTVLSIIVRDGTGARRARVKTV